MLSLGSTVFRPFAAIVAGLLLAGGPLPAQAPAANPPPEPVYQLDPMVVTALTPPIIKHAEHPMIEPRFGAAAVAEGDFLYVIGGSNSEGTRLDTIERIDLRTGQANLWARLKIARRHHRAVILAGKIYVLGGTSGAVAPEDPLSEELSDYGGDEAPVGYQPPPPAIRATGYQHESTVEIIDLATGRTSFGPAMPFAKALFGCAVVNGRILVIGGQKRKGDAIFLTNTTEVFDPEAGTWCAGVNMPTARRGTACMVDGFVLFLGGFGGNRLLRTVEVFNPWDGSWKRLQDLAEPLNPSAMVWSGAYLLLFGDQNARHRQLAYDLRTKQLASYPLPLPDADFAAALMHRGKIYVVGGASLRFHQASPGIQVFTPVQAAQPVPP